MDGDLITYTGSTIKRLDVNTGKVLAEGTMAGTSSFSINPATYADGMIFVGLSGGKIQAFNAKTLESLWIYTDPLGGQPKYLPDIPRRLHLCRLLERREQARQLRCHLRDGRGPDEDG